MSEGASYRVTEWWRDLVGAFDAALHPEEIAHVAESLQVVERLRACPFGPTFIGLGTITARLWRWYRQDHGFGIVKAIIWETIARSWLIALVGTITARLWFWYRQNHDLGDDCGQIMACGVGRDDDGQIVALVSARLWLWYRQSHNMGDDYGQILALVETTTARL